MKAKYLPVAALLAVAVGGAAYARGGDGLAELHGTLQAVDTASVTIAPSVGDAVTLNVTAATLIEAGEDNTLGTLADLHTGAEVEAKYDPATLNAVKIESEAPDTEAEVTGTVLSASFDTTTNTGSVAVDVNGDTVADLTLDADASTDFELGKAHLDPSQAGLLVGLTAEVKYDSATNLAQVVKAEVPEPLQAQGTVSAVDAAAGTLTVRTAGGDVTFSVPAGVEVRLKSLRMPLSGLNVGDQVRVSYLVLGDAATNVAVGIQVQGSPSKPKHVTGSLTSADALAGTVDIAGRSGDVLLTVTSSTELRANGKRIALADLQTALAAAAAAGKSVKAQSQYYVRGDANVANRIEVNLKSGGHGH